MNGMSGIFYVNGSSSESSESIKRAATSSEDDPGHGGGHGGHGLGSVEAGAGDEMQVVLVAARPQLTTSFLKSNKKRKSSAVGIAKFNPTVKMLQIESFQNGDSSNGAAGSSSCSSRKPVSKQTSTGT
jgi:hypothetical protein